MMSHLPLLSLSAAVAALFYASLPSPSLTPPAELRTGQVVSGSADITMDGRLTLKGSSIELVGLELASPSELCTDADGHTASCDKAIARFLHDKAAGGQVKCWMQMDQANTLSARCSIDDSDLNAMLVHAGLARANPLSAPDYTGLEADAQTARSGIWKVSVSRS